MDVAEYKLLARKPNKYKAVRTTVDGFTFDSKLEATRYSQLKVLERAGEISDLKLQPAFLIEWNGTRICVVRGDFEFVENGKSVVIDVKGYDNPVSKIKRKLVCAMYPHIDWRVVKR
jgi:hypothetical protein